MRIFILTLLFSIFAAAPAFATTRFSDDFNDFLELTQPLEQGTAGRAGSERQWSGTLGAGLLSAPTYLGGGDNEARFLPVVDIEFKQRYFISTQRGIGFYFFRDNRFALATMVNMDWGRDESDNARLTGLGDVDPSAQLGVDIKWYITRWFSFNADAYQAISPGGHEGAYGDLGFGFRWPVSKNFMFRANTGMRWASDSYMSHLYGVNAGQSTASGLPQFNPGGGAIAWQLGAALDFMMGNGWVATPMFRYVSLSGDAADSPVTQDDAEYYAGVFIGYKF